MKRCSFPRIVASKTPRRKTPAKSTPKAPRAPKIDAQAHADGWGNVITGLGQINRDKRLSSSHTTSLLTLEQLEDLWTNEPIAARLVEIFPEDMFREGFEIVTADSDPTVVEKLEDAIEALEVEEALELAACTERAMYGAGVYIGAVDGKTPDQPLNEGNIQSIDHLTVYNSRELRPWVYYRDPTKPKVGEVSHFLLMPDSVSGSTTMLIHESRVIVFGGIKTTRRMQHTRGEADGWGTCMLQRIHERIRAVAGGWDAADALLQDFAQSVIRIKGFADLVANNQDDLLRKRLQALDLGRSVIRSMVMDTDEDYERKATPVAGLAEIVNCLVLPLCATAGIPVTRFMGLQPTGLNATGDADIRAYYDRVRSEQRKKIRPRLRRVIRLLMLAKNGPTQGKELEKWKIKFRSLYQLTPLEDADLRGKTADTDQKYIASGVLMPEEVTASRFGTEYSTETTVDMDSRERMAAAEARVAGHEQVAAGVDPEAKPSEKPAPEDDPEDE